MKNRVIENQNSTPASGSSPSPTQSRPYKGLLERAIPSIFGGVLILILERTSQSINPSDYWVLFGAFILWIFVSAFLLHRIKYRLLRLGIEVVLIVACIAIIAVPFARERHRETEARFRVLERVFKGGKELKTAAKHQLYRALNEAALPFDDDGVRGRFVDANHEYDSIRVDFTEMKKAGIVEWELKGRTLQYQPSGRVRFPFGSNHELPLDGLEYVRVSDLRPDPPVNITLDTDFIDTGHRTFLYEAAIPDFKGDLHYRRELCHPTSQTFNPDAFVVFLDMISGPVDDLVLRLFVDQPVNKVMLKAPGEFNPETSEFSWRDLEPHSDGRISAEVIAGKNAEAGPRGAGLVDGYFFHLENPEKQRLFVLYYKGPPLEAIQFLSTLAEGASLAY